MTWESENDNSNEVPSIDTGRGSSLTTSDTDKGQHSPEYFLNCSPSNEENIAIKEKTKDTIRPVLVEESETPTIAIVKHNENPNNACEAHITSHRKRHSKLKGTVNQNNAAMEVSQSIDTSDNFSPKKRNWNVQEKECLELNNRLQSESHTDLELENIFNSMKLNYNAVSPIPRTPMLMHEIDSTSSSSEASENSKKVSVLCYKTLDFVRILMGLVLSQNLDNNSSIMNKLDKLIESFESISKSEHSKYITDSNMEISDCIENPMFSRVEDNRLGSISNPKSTTSSSEKETEIFQNKKNDNILLHNVKTYKLNQLPHDDNNSVVTSWNPASPDKHTNILMNKQVENQKQLLNHSVCEELSKDREISEVPDNVRCSRDTVEIHQPSIKKSIGKKAKTIKNTKLEKLKKKLKPRYKIKMDPENVRVRPKQHFPINKKGKVSVNDTSATLNDKEAYEKAVKFMAEMKSQQGTKAKSSKHTKVLMPPTHPTCLEKYITSSNDDHVLQDCSISTSKKRKISELFDNCTVVLIKDPLLLSPSKAKNSITDKAEQDNYPTSHETKENKNLSTHKEKKDNNAKVDRTEENNNSSTHSAKEDTNSWTYRAKDDNNTTTHRIVEDINSTAHREKEDNNSATHIAKEVINSSTHRATEDNNSAIHEEKCDNNSMYKGEENNKSSDEVPSRKRHGHSSNEPESPVYKRILRSANIHTRLSSEENIEPSKSKVKNNRKSTMGPNTNDSGAHFNNENTLQRIQLDLHDNNAVSYGELDVFSDDTQKMSSSVIAKQGNDSTTQIVKEGSNFTIGAVNVDNNALTHGAKEDNNSLTHKGAEDNESSDEPLRKRRRHSSNQPLVQYKRVLRNAPIQTRSSTDDNIELNKSTDENSKKLIMGSNTNESVMKFNKEASPKCSQLDHHVNSAVSYEDLDVFSEDIQLDKETSAPIRDGNTDASTCHPEESILCYMIQKHAKEVVRPHGKKISGMS